MSNKKMSDTELEELSIILAVISNHFLLSSVTSNERVAVLYEIERHDSSLLKVISYSDLILGRTETFNEEFDAEKFNKILSWMESEQ